MSYVAGKEDKEGVEAGFNAKSHKIRITLTAQGPKLKALEKGVSHSTLVECYGLCWYILLLCVT